VTRGASSSRGGLDGHDRAARLFTRFLMEAGFEVLIRASPYA